MYALLRSVKYSTWLMITNNLFEKWWRWWLTHTQHGSKMSYNTPIIIVIHSIFLEVIYITFLSLKNNSRAWKALSTDPVVNPLQNSWTVSMRIPNKKTQPNWGCQTKRDYPIGIQMNAVWSSASFSLWTVFVLVRYFFESLSCLCMLHGLSSCCAQGHEKMQCALRGCVRRGIYGVVPEGLLTFLGSLYKGGAKASPGTLVYRFKRQTARKNISSFQKHCVLDLECRILSQEPSDSFILDFNVIFHGK